MHELSVTHNILDVALRHAGDKRITNIYLVIGQLSSFVDESIQFYWSIISKDTLAENAQLSFQRLPAIMRCEDCGERYQLAGDDFACPACGSLAVQLVSGDEFYIDAIDVETSEEELIT